MTTLFRRRTILAGSAAFAAGAFTPVVRAERLAPQSLPDGLDPRQLLGDTLTRRLDETLPPELKLAAEIAQGVIRLETEARDQALPLSPLSRPEKALSPDPQSLYRLAMPRLVALIDRAGQASPQLAEQAGGLLARLHATQHLVPARFGFQPRGLLAAPPGGIELPRLGLPPLRLDELPESDGIGTAIDLPPVDQPVPVLSKSRTFADLAEEYRTLFGLARLRDEFVEEADWHLTMMRQARRRYEAVGERAQVPWQFIAAIHGLESSFNFRAHLHNGDFPLSQRTRQVPAGRPLRWLPPSDWESSAIDALRSLGFTGQQDWSLPRMLYRIEAFNGFGYRRYARPSPYLWSFSTIYERGKFIADGRYDPRARSQQCGAAVMLKLLELNGELDIAAG